MKFIVYSPIDPCFFVLNTLALFVSSGTNRKNWSFARVEVEEIKKGFPIIG
ncbi:MAG: hypothetical protein V5787_06325 [Flavicella sp.]